MAAIRPFRALRAKTARIDAGALIVDDEPMSATSPANADPRSLARVLRVRNAPGDAADVATTRARFHLAELLRTGLLARDAMPALYALRVVDGESARTGFFAAARTDALTGADADADTDDTLVAGGVVGDAVVVGFSDKKGRVARALETETEREPDVSFRSGARSFELWVVDEENAAARVTALVESASPRVLGGALAALANARARAASATGAGTDDASAFCLAFFVDDESPIAHVPAGVVLLPVQGAL
jgi:hypothetical protein